MGVVGHWDPELFASFRAAPDGSGLRRRLLNELLRINEPLIRVLAAQLANRPLRESHARATRNRMRVIGAELLDWDEVLNIARFAFTKAAERFDPNKGKISYFLKCKIFYELQCAVMAHSIVRVERGARAPGMKYVDDDEQLDWLTGGVDDRDERDDEPEPVIALPRPLPLQAPPPPPKPPFDLRPALDVFLEEHCRFAPSARAAAMPVRHRFAGVARSRGELALHNALVTALRARGVRGTSVRVPWAPNPVEGLKGVSLQNTAKPGSASP